MTYLDHRIFFESSFSVFWGTSVVIIFGRKWSYKKTFESTTHLLCKIMIMVKEVSPVPYCSTHFSWTIEYYHLSSIIIDIWYFISYGQYNTIITDNLQLFIYHITWAIAFASFSCFSAIFRASEEIQDCLCHHFVGLCILLRRSRVKSER